MEAALCGLHHSKACTDKERNYCTAPAYQYADYLHTTMTSKTDLLTYHKEVLEKISRADVPTFRKELRKAFKRLVPEDRKALKAWFRSSCVCRVVSVQ